MTSRGTDDRNRLVIIPDLGCTSRDTTPFLERLSQSDHRTLVDAAEPHTYRAGHAVFRQDTFPDMLLLVRGGHLQESHITRDGHEVILDIHGPGDVVGAVGTIDSTPALATVRASVRADALVVQGATLRSLLTSCPTLAVALLRVLAEHVAEAERARIQSATQEVLPRITRRLIHMAERWGERRDDGIAISLHLSQAELAAWAGVSREAAVKALRILREQGLVDTGRCRLKVTDLESLRAYAAA